MNTPTHIVLSLAGLAVAERVLSLGQPRHDPHHGNLEPSWRGCAAAAAIGAILPDAPMFAFYAIEKLVLGNEEQVIWNDRYFLPAWQDFFDFFNSIPFVLLGLFIAGWLSQAGRVVGRWWYALMASMLLHLLCDLPVHHDDGHRHFWPIWNWRFESPLSYWDPRHHGLLVSFLEYVVFVVCTAMAIRMSVTGRWRYLVLGMAVVHSAMMYHMWAYFLGAH